MNQPTRERATYLFSTLAHPTRLKIVELLLCAREPMTTNEICQTLGLSHSGTTQNLASLTRAGILQMEQKGEWRFFQLRESRVKQIILLVEEFCHINELYGIPTGEALPG